MRNRPDDLPVNSEKSPQAVTLLVLMVCGYIFLFIERPWESVSFLHGVQIERWYAVAMLLVAFLNHKLNIAPSPTNKWVYSLLLLHFVLAPFAFSTELAVEQGIEYSKMVVLYLLMLAVAYDEATLKILLKAYFLTMIFYALHSLIEFFNGRHVYRMGISRMLGVDETYSDPNAFGASLVLSLPIAFVLLRSEKNLWVKRIYFCYFPLVAFCIIQTGSRSAFVALFTLTFMWAFTQQRKQIVKILVLAVIAISIVWNVMPEEKQTRIRSLWDEDAGPANAHESAEGRKTGFKVSWKMFKREPWTGVGAGGKNFIGYRLRNNIDEEGHESATQSHILYGEVLAEFGIFGALCMTGLIITIVKCCVQARKKLADRGVGDSFLSSLTGAILICLILLLLLGFGGHNFYRPLWLWLAAWSGSLLILATTNTNGSTMKSS